MGGLARHGRLVELAAVAALVIVPGLMLTSGYHLRVGALVFISGLAALGLNILMGYAGQVSLGHAGFFAIGAYAAAVGPAHLGVPPLGAVLAGMALAGGLAFAVGGPILRLSGHYLAVATLALGILITMVATNEVRWTGGPDGMDVARLELWGVRIRTPLQWYWLSGLLLVAGVAVAQNLIGSPTGRALRAVHDSETAAGVLGIETARYKLIAFVISAVYAALAGACLALFNGQITPVSSGFLHSVELVTMVVLGGMGSILGSVVGAAVLVVLPQLLVVFHEYEHLVLGLIMIATMIVLPRGIVPSLIGLFGGRRA